MLVDTHCHLDFDPLNGDLESVLERAEAAGVHRIVVPSFDAASRREVARLGRLESVFPAVGLHPWAADEPLDAVDLAREAQSCRAVAIGEIGLDTKVEQPSFDAQMRVFSSQLDVASKLDLPVILHCRGAFDELIRIITNQPHPVRGVVHAYSRGPELAQRLIDAGLLLGIGGAATRPRARRLHRTLKRVPLDRIVLETDAPSIGLDGIRPEQTEPRHVADIARAVAMLTDTDLATVAQRTTTNAEALFGLEAGRGCQE